MDYQATDRGDVDEIDLRAYAGVLWRWRAIVVTITVVAIAIAWLASLLTPPMYEATSVLMVARSPYQVGAPPDPTNPGLKIGSAPPQDIPVETLVAFAKHPSTIQALAGRVHGSSRSRLGVQMKAATIRNTNLVDLRVRGKNPEEVAKIANAWGAVVLSKSQALFASTARRSLTFFQGRMREANRALRAAEQTHRNFAAASRITLLQTRVNAVTGQISGYRSRLVDLTISIERAKTEFAQTEAQLARQPRTFVLTKFLDSDPLMMQATRDGTRRDITQLSTLSLRAEELNPVYLSLAQARTNLMIQIRTLETEREQVQAALAGLNGELDQVRRQLATDQLTASRLAEAVTTARQTYGVLLERSEESRVASAADADSAPVRVVADAVTPETPVGSRRLLILGLAGMLGLVVGSLSAFIADAVKTTAERRHLVRGDAAVHPIP